MIKISHEVPVPLLEKSLEFNDYEYSLTHLLDTDRDYYNFYFNSSINLKRESIMDNSIFEGNPLDWDSYVNYITNIKPTYYIIPDTIGDKEKTLLDFDKFTKSYLNLPGTPMAVVQGGTYDELLECFEFYLHNDIPKIAVVFHSKAYIEDEACNINQNRMNGRIKLIKMIWGKFADTIKAKNVKIHLLGASLPQEFYHYGYLNEFNVIDSIDTSNPILVGMTGYEYNITEDGKFRLNDKPSEVMMNEFHDIVPSEEIMEKIKNNIKNFKRIVNG